MSSTATSKRGPLRKDAKASSALGEAGDARRAGRLQDLLDIERDQQFVVHHQTAFAGEHGTRLRHEGLLQFLNGTFSLCPELNSSGI